MPTFGQKVRELRQAKRLNQRALAAKIGVNFTYISRIENENLDFGLYPSEALIVRLAQALDADEHEFAGPGEDAVLNRLEAQWNL